MSICASASAWHFAIRRTSVRARGVGRISTQRASLPLRRFATKPLRTQRCTKATVPWWLAWTATAVGELVADRVTHRPPAASLNGLRLVRRPLDYVSRLAAEDLDWRARPLDETLRDAIADLTARGLL